MSSKGGKRGGKKREDGGKSKKGTPKKQKVVAPTVKEIIEDELTQLSLAHWAPLGPEQSEEVSSRKYDPKIVDSIYNRELKTYQPHRIMLLEVSHYLENYLWKNYQPKKCSLAHLVSILMMVNEKFREGVSAWDCFHTREDVFPGFFEDFLDVREKLSIVEKTHYVAFLINCFQSLEDAMVRKECLKLTSLPTWNVLNPQTLERELKALPKIEKHWSYLKKQEKDRKDTKMVQHEKTFLPNLIDEYLGILSTVSKKNVALDEIHYCERFAELLLDLISQLPTRRFFHIVVQDKHVVIKSQMSELASMPEGRLFSQLVEMLRFFEGFEVNNFTGKALTDEEITVRQTSKIRALQRIAFQHFQPELKGLALSNIASLENRDGLIYHLKQLSDPQLRELCTKLILLPAGKGEPKEARDFMIEIIVAAHEKRMSQIEAVSEMSLFPTEDIMWNDTIIPSDQYTGEKCLALPKLNLQFLTFYDYLLRNYDLYRLESAYEIREDIEDAVKRCNPRKDHTSTGAIESKFTGWSRMSVPIKEFRVTHTGKAKLGEDRPSEVSAEIQYTVQAFKGQIRNEWDSIKQHDVLFLVTCRPPYFVGEEIDTKLPFPDQYGVVYVRGCEVKDILDEEGVPIKDYEVEESPRNGNLRTIRVSLDCAQYKHDLDQKDEDVYGSFNLLVRRKPKENNFKAVLETIRDLMNTKTVMPEWLHDVFLGYGDPNSAQDEDAKSATVDFVDTFIDVKHAIASFPDRKIELVGKDGKSLGPAGKVDSSALGELTPPFRVVFPTSQEETLQVQSYLPPHPGPFPQNVPKRNSVPFTPRQVEAIRSSMNPGLTLVVGPPGTGKTDVAVQMISNWYHNFPDQRILLVTHSNQALNQLFEKIMALDIDERHLLRLGHGGEDLETEKDFSKFGRVNYMLARRLQLLEEVDKLGKSFAVLDDVAYTCETADHFYFSFVLSAWEQFHKKLEEVGHTSAAVAKSFPFKRYFSGAPKPLFPGRSFEDDMRIAEGCFRHLQRIFIELQECRAFELMRNQYDRANYLVTKQARIVAMTCTHAALKRAELVSLGFKYDNLLMEEAAQILEIETFIPMLLQEHGAKEGCRLKRVVLIGDHNQLPPIVKNIAFQKYAHLDQSLFTRFVRLGVPTVDLNAQGRARPSIAQLYNWRYKELKDLTITNSGEFTLANTGFGLDYQLVNVEDYDDQGEFSPNPFFYQNLGEAEYVVATFMYMRLLGYPASKITVLTTYNGQKHLIRDVLKARCEWNPYYGRPKVSTVDRYQGQQNDYILLSLVRTKAVGHLRDVRRLVVAMSRARLGLYVFCRRALFENCYELTPTFAKFVQQPDKLQLVEGEAYPTQRKSSDSATLFQVEDVVHMGNLVSSMQAKLLEVQKEEAELAAKQKQEQEAAEKAAAEQAAMEQIQQAQAMEEDEE